MGIINKDNAESLLDTILERRSSFRKYEYDWVNPETQFDEFLAEVGETFRDLAMEMKKRAMVLTMLEETIKAHKSNEFCPKGIGFITVSKFEPNGKILATLMDSRTHKYIGEYIDMNSIYESLMSIYRNHSL